MIDSSSTNVAPRSAARPPPSMGPRRACHPSTGAVSGGRREHARRSAHHTQGRKTAQRAAQHTACLCLLSVWLLIGRKFLLCSSHPPPPGFGNRKDRREACLLLLRLRAHVTPLPGRAISGVWGVRQCACIPSGLKPAAAPVARAPLALARRPALAMDGSKGNLSRLRVSPSN